MNGRGLQGDFGKKDGKIGFWARGKGGKWPLFMIYPFVIHEQFTTV
jgi:hypothetical protein